MAELVLTDLHKDFGPVKVIRGVSLRAESGEFVVFVGPSGCGKSTLLRMIAGLEATSSGTIAIDGRDVTRVDPSKRGIAMVFQTYALYPHMTVAENMGFGLEMAGVKPPERMQRVRAAARTLQLEDYLDRKPRQLSGGQRQRVAIGRAIVRDPDVFLFDEPLSNLDAELRVQMRLEIARLHADLRATMIYVTHDQVEAMTLADKIVVLRDGRVEQVGRPLELYNDPDNIFVAGFIGAPRMNLLEADMRTVDASGALVLDVPALGLSGFPVRPRRAVADAAAAPPRVTLGIRPEHFQPGTRGPFAVALTATTVERLGNLSYLHTAPGEPHSLVAELRGDAGAKPAETVAMTLDPAGCFLFDADGRRL